MIRLIQLIQVAKITWITGTRVVTGLIQVIQVSTPELGGRKKPSIQFLILNL